MATSDLGAFSARCEAAGVPVLFLGTVGGDRVRLGEMVDLAVGDIERRRRNALEEALASVH
jgi:hypothetical protein